MRLKFIILAFIITCFPLIAFSSSCNDIVLGAIKKASVKNSKFSEQEKAFLLHSSSKSGIPHFLGNKTACDENPLMKYFVAITDFRPGKDRRQQEGHGVCLPKECNNKEAIHNQKLIKDIFAFKKWKTVKNSEMLLYDPTQSKSEKSWAYYGACFIFVNLAAFALISTFAAYTSKKRANEIPIIPTTQIINNKLHWAFESFDLKSNFISLYQTAKEQKLNENIAIFNFLRVITSFWVIYYHTQYSFAKSSNNYGAYWASYKKSKVLYSFWQGGDMSVEYFFVMTGFLSAYTLIPKLSKMKLGFGSYLTLVKHRWLRVWPALMMGVLFWWLIMPQMFSGPMWFNFEYKVGYCDQLWWSKALLIDNITNYYTFESAGNYCMIITWYIPTEFQIYLVAIIAIAVYTRYRKIGYAVVITLICQSLWMGIANCLNHKLSYPTLRDNTLWHYFRMTPFTRWYTLFIGVLWGILYYEYSKLQKKNIFYVFEKKPIVSYISMILGFALNTFVILFPTWTWGATLKSVWYPLRLLLISIAMTMMFMPLASNREFYLKKFFNLRIFQILGKCSYMTYLFADSWIYVLAFAYPTTITKYSDSLMLTNTLKVFLISQPVAILAHLVIEKPLLNLEANISKLKQVFVSPKKYQPIQESTDSEIEITSSSVIRKVQ